MFRDGLERKQRSFVQHCCPGSCLAAIEGGADPREARHALNDRLGVATNVMALFRDVRTMHPGFNK